MSVDVYSEEDLIEFARIDKEYLEFLKQRCSTAKNTLLTSGFLKRKLYNMTFVNYLFELINLEGIYKYDKIDNLNRTNEDWYTCFYHDVSWNIRKENGICCCPVCFDIINYNNMCNKEFSKGEKGRRFNLNVFKPEHRFYLLENLMKNRGGKIDGKPDDFERGDNITLICKDGHITTCNININQINLNKCCGTEGMRKKNSYTKEEGLLRCKVAADNKNGKCLSKEYGGWNDTLLWQCKNHKHPPFKSTYNSVVNLKRWCPNCAIESRTFGKVSEQKIRRFVEKFFNKDFPSIRPSWNKNLKGDSPFILECERELLKYKTKTKNEKNVLSLELDGYCEELGVAFEYDGKQHYDLSHFGGRGNKYTQHAYIKLNDYQKDINCKRQGVTLVRIPYVWQNKQENFQYYHDRVVNAFKEVGIEVSYSEEQLEELRNEFKWVKPRAIKEKKELIKVEKKKQGSKKNPKPRTHLSYDEIRQNIKKRFDRNRNL